MKNRILITGAAGFVASHLIPSLLKNDLGCRIFGIDRHTPAIEEKDHQVAFSAVDLLEPESVRKAVSQFRPTHIYHLAGFSSVVESYVNPQGAFRVNQDTTLNLLDAVLKLKIKPKILLVSSGQLYGRLFLKKPRPQETDPVSPMSPYALSKLMVEGIGLYYFHNFGIPVYIARPLNHVGPGQNPHYSVAHFASQFARMRPGAVNKLTVGNIDVLRDYTDVRDIVRAYELILKNGKPGEIYNLGCGKAVSLRWIIKQFEHISGCGVRIVSHAKSRPDDIKRMQVSIAKAWKKLGWKLEIPFEETLRDIYFYFKKS